MSYRYELIEHTADIGIRSYGKDQKQLFINAAWGMFDILADLEQVSAKESVKINLKAPNLEELFLSWLRELLYRHNAKKIIFNKFAINKLTENSLSARVQGEKLDLKRHQLKREIKAVTYHQLRVKKVKDIWQGEIIFDV